MNAADPTPFARSGERPGLHLLLFFLTLVTTTVAGAIHYDAFASDFLQTRIAPQRWLPWLAQGLWYSLPILAILSTHEAGHYLTCRYYRLPASLPYFIFLPPLWPYFFTGTAGAFIRIRAPFRSKRELFDVGVAGPIAGFIVAAVALFIGLSLSRVVRLPYRFEGINLGEPLLWQWAVQLVWDTPPPGHTLNMHPMAFAAWFGMLATALNLIPIGQLDGGHITYAVLGRRSEWVTKIAVLAVIALTFVSLSWLLWAVIVTLFVVVAGARHPPTLDDAPLDGVRLLIALIAVGILVVCFTPVPLEALKLIGGKPI